MSKEEEILYKHLSPLYDHTEDMVNNLGPIHNELLAAMSEHAMNESIGFNEWLNDEFWVRDPFPNKHTGLIMWTKFEGDPAESKTIQQLYTLYTNRDKN